jgi:hypothetical protein
MALDETRERTIMPPQNHHTGEVCVKAEVGCPQNTDLRCPLFTDEIVQLSCSDRGIGCHLLSGRDGPPTEEPSLPLLP